MSTSSQSCGVCELRHITKPSIVFCTECDQGLCAECNEHHSLSKSLKSHSVISVIDYQNLPAGILKATQFCTKHDKTYQIYCKKHECPCCSKCIVESHKECRDFVELNDVIHNVKTYNAMCEIMETLVEVAENLQKVRQHQQDNLTYLKNSRREIEKEIRTTRIQINNHLDKLQEDLIKQLHSMEQKENSQICHLLSSLEKKEKEIADCQRNIMNIKQHATDLQLFLSMKQVEADVYRKNEFLQSLEEDKNFNQTSLSYKINTSIQDIFSDILKFGEVRVESKSCDIVLIRKKTKQAQMMVPTIQSRTIHNIKVTKQTTINTQLLCTNGCSMISNDRLAFSSDMDSRINIFNITGLKEFEVMMPCHTFDIVYINEENALAVTSGMSIYFIDLERKQIKETFTIDSEGYGIALNDNQLVYSGYDKGIRMINLHDDSISDIVNAMPSNCFIATIRDNIFHTNIFSNAVTCCNLKGKIQWKFKNESVLQGPRGIDVDNDGNVFVVGRYSNNVVAISPDGQRHREILTESDGLRDPVSLHYSEPTKQLLVANKLDNEAHLFNLI